MDIFWEFFRYIVPPRDEQNEITLLFGIHLTIASLSLAYMGYLARQPNTRLQRLLFFPIPFLMLIRLLLAYRWTNPDFLAFTLGKSFSCIVLAVRTVEFASIDNNGIRAREDSQSKEKPLPKSTFVDKFIDGFLQGTGIIFSVRGIGYEPHNSKLDVYIPKETKPLERRAFICCTLRSFLLHMLAIDFIESCWKFYPPFKQEQGGSIFVSGFPWYIQLPFSGILLLATIIVFCCLLQGIYDLCTLFGVVILRHSPLDWPPIFDRPFHKKSMGSFWAIGWHSLGRRTFLYMGGYPMRWIFQHLGIDGDIGLVIGCFFASGIIHEFPLYWLCLPFDWRTSGFFMIQPVALFLERIWKSKTGRRVGGLPGMIWAYAFWSISLGPQLFDSYHRRGLGYTILIHPAISPTRQILFPMLSKLFSHP